MNTSNILNRNDQKRERQLNKSEMSVNKYKPENKTLKKINKLAHLEQNANEYGYNNCNNYLWASIMV